MTAVRDLFPSLDGIEDDALRDATAAVWRAAVERRGWSLDDVSRVPASLHIADLGIDLVSHTRAVTAVVMAAADAYDEHYPRDAYDLDRDTLLSGALLHDVGKVLEYTEADGEWTQSAAGEFVRHPFSGVALCDAHGVPPAVQHVIAFHSHEGDPYERSPEAAIVHLADFINFDPLR